MEEFEQNSKEEFEYLEKTLSFLKNEIDKGNKLITDRRSKLISSRRDMWENSAHHSEDFEKMTDINVHLMGVNSELAGYLNTLNMIEKYEKVIKAPYFGRFNFEEEGFSGIEKIYIGLYNVMDSQTNNIIVYDWRAPISGIFYQYELGRASYKSPMGDLVGEVSLKRQYKIKDSILKYFFDCSISITDELLQEVLSHNASTKMKNIVETIQRDQDRIIRDVDNELMIVQGVAGSGKTSIALHRIAFLLYYGTNSKLGTNNILIISPTLVFSKYISSVLPELGEENVSQLTFEEITDKHLDNRLKIEKRNTQLENLILEQNKYLSDFKRECILFKGSDVFVKILQRLTRYYERRVIPIEDIYYSGRIIASKQNIKNLLLNNKINMPLCKRLKRIENRILDRVHPLQKQRLECIENIVSQYEEHQLEVKTFSRLLSIKETKKIMERMRKFTEVDYFNLYKILFTNEGLLYKLAKGIILPANINQIIIETKENLLKGIVNYEDSAPLLYLKLMLEGSDSFSDIKQVVIDEAQDYYPIQYEIFRLLFASSKFTILGDINQTIEKEGTNLLYESIEEILDKNKSVRLSLNKSYRSSTEINYFNQKILNRNNGLISFERHEEEPLIVKAASQEMIDEKIVKDIKQFFEEGYESLAVICKTQAEAREVYLRIGNQVGIKLFNSDEAEIEKGAIIIPTYMSKGLEFDVVLVYGVSDESYCSEYDRKLLYIACTRALHRLILYYTGEKSQQLEKFINEIEIVGAPQY